PVARPAVGDGGRRAAVAPRGWGRGRGRGGRGRGRGGRAGRGGCGGRVSGGQVGGVGRGGRGGGEENPLAVGPEPEDRADAGSDDAGHVVGDLVLRAERVRRRPDDDLRDDQADRVEDDEQD